MVGFGKGGRGLSFFKAKVLAGRQVKAEVIRQKAETQTRQSLSIFKCPPWRRRCRCGGF